jgi:hypothetical protein
MPVSASCLRQRVHTRSKLDIERGHPADVVSRQLDSDPAVGIRPLRMVVQLLTMQGSRSHEAERLDKIRKAVIATNPPLGLLPAMELLQSFRESSARKDRAFHVLKATPLIKDLPGRRARSSNMTPY